MHNGMAAENNRDHSVEIIADMWRTGLAQTLKDSSIEKYQQLIGRQFQMGLGIL